ncbi:MAG TPA: formate dehydrogenase accessory sulfurtransferase FdhD [Burkholderiaceae bacterium]|nr:formate dehydrogenase accessory sulfurtransferase FdhD [Burkholderiaceae bacterium]
MNDLTQHALRRLELPVLTRNARPATFVVDAIDEHGQVVPTHIAGEHPLTLYLNKRELVTLMTLGCAPEHLALGWLRNQRLVQSIYDIASVQVDWETDSVAITMHDPDFWEHALIDRRTATRTVTTGCGQGTVFGDLMDDLDNIVIPEGEPIERETLLRIVDEIRMEQSIYKVAGAVHGCALFWNRPDARGELIHFVEDVGRHNAVDAIAGHMWLESLSGHDKIFYTTGRLTSEMVIKCAQMEIPILISRSGLTKMGHDVATKLGVTLIGRCVGKHHLVFSGAHRVRP